MTSNLPLPTEAEIELQAALVHPDCKILQMSFIMGVWHTIYKLKDKN
jgi:hypothetical protein